MKAHLCITLLVVLSNIISHAKFPFTLKVRSAPATIAHRSVELRLQKSDTDR